MSFVQFYCGLHFLSGSSLHIPPRIFGWVGNYLTCTELNHLALLITRVQTYLHVSTRSYLLKPSKQHFKGLAFSGIHSYSYPPVWGCTIFARFTLPLWRRVRVQDYLYTYVTGIFQESSDSWNQVDSWGNLIESTTRLTYQPPTCLYPAMNA